MSTARGFDTVGGREGEIFGKMKGRYLTKY